MEDFVPFEFACKLKNKGFKERCYAYYMPFDTTLCYNHSPFRGAIVDDCLKSHNCLDDELVASDFVDAPTIPQVLKWLRKEKNISVEPYACASGWRVTICNAGNVLKNDCSGGTVIVNDVPGPNDGAAYDTFEEAAIAGAKHAVEELIKKHK